MKFGIFAFGDNPPGDRPDPTRSITEEVLTMAEWAEELGSSILFSASASITFTGTAPVVSPPMIIAARSRSVPRKSGWGPAISVLPFHHPLIVAEEYASGGQPCGGRLNFAVGSGFSRSNTRLSGCRWRKREKGTGEGFDVIPETHGDRTEFSSPGKFYQIENFFMDETLAEAHAAHSVAASKRRDFD